MKRRDLLRSLMGRSPAEPTPAPDPAGFAADHAPDEEARGEAMRRAEQQQALIAQGWGAAGAPGRKLNIQDLLERTATPAAPAPQAPLRPPGALPEADLLALCTRCGACTTACPHDAILPVRAGALAGTPTLILTQRPCSMCDPAPCIASCEPGALSAQAPRAIGTASVKLSRCLAKTGCTRCVERCPVEGALTWSPLGTPRVDAALCDGCGMCQHICPAPDNAIIILPRPRERDERVPSAATPTPRAP